jgi:hypothetical protein
MGENDEGLLPLIAFFPLLFFTLILFYLVWAAMHDLAHGDEGALEWSVLAVCALAFPFLYWLVLRILTGTARLVWLIGTGVLVALFSIGAISSMLHPKYAKDPMLGATFLTAALPALGAIAYHFLRELQNRRGATAIRSGSVR